MRCPRRIRRPGSWQREVVTMVLDYLLGGSVTAVLLVYLVYALLRPEHF